MCDAVRAPRPTTLVLCVCLLCLVWGSTWIVIAEGLRDLPPFTSAGLRFVIAAVGMAIVAAAFADREGGEHPPRRLVVVMGTLNFGLSYGIVYWVETRVPSSLVAVLWAVFPLMLAVASRRDLPGERLRGSQWLGLVTGFLGVVVLFTKDLRQLGTGAVVGGAVLLVSPFVSAIGTVAVKRDGAAVSSLRLNRNAMVIGAVLLLVAAALFERGMPVHFTPRAIASLLYLALMGTVLTFGLYYWAMRYAPAYQLALIAYVTPGIAIALGAWGADEPVSGYTILGFALILSGVGAVLRRGGAGFRARADSGATEEPG